MTATTVRPTAYETQPSVAAEQAYPVAPQTDAALEQSAPDVLPEPQAASGTTLHPLLRHLPLKHFTEGRKKLQAAGEHVAAHTAAREAGNPEADYQVINDHLGVAKDVVTGSLKKNWWLLSAALPVAGLRLARETFRRNQARPEEAKEFTEAVKRRLGALATSSAARSSDWLLDKVHNVDWWELAKVATTAPEIEALVNASAAAGPYGRAAKAAYMALEAAVVYHEAPKRGNGRAPAIFGAIVSHALHQNLKKNKDFIEGKAAVERIIHTAAKLRAAKA